jgi:type II secretory pathway component GspD/PulD (secretin)
VERGGSLTGQYNQLIVRTSPRNLADIRAALEAIDRPQRRLVISVRFEDAATGERSGVAVDRAGVRIAESRSARDDRVDQRVQVLEGGRATIASGQSRPLPQRQVIRTPGGVVIQDNVAIQEIATGFEVVPRMSGRNVMLEIAPQRETPGAFGAVQSHRAATTVSAPLGEWFEIGGTAQSSDRDQRGILSSAQSRGTESRRIWVKVEELAN